MIENYQNIGRQPEPKFEQAERLKYIREKFPKTFAIEEHLRNTFKDFTYKNLNDTKAFSSGLEKAKEKSVKANYPRSEFDTSNLLKKVNFFRKLSDLKPVGELNDLKPAREPNHFSKELDTFKLLNDIVKKGGFDEVLMTTGLSVTNTDNTAPDIKKAMPSIPFNFLGFPYEHLTPLNTLAHESTNPDKTTPLVQRGLELLVLENRQLFKGKSYEKVIELYNSQEKSPSNISEYSDISRQMLQSAGEQFINEIKGENRDVVKEIATLEVFEEMLTLGVKDGLGLDKKADVISLNGLYGQILDDKTKVNIIKEKTKIREELKEAYKKQVK